MAYSSISPKHNHGIIMSNLFSMAPTLNSRVYDHYPFCNDQRFGFLKYLSLNGVLTSMIKYYLNQLRYSTSILLSSMYMAMVALRNYIPGECLRY